MYFLDSGLYSSFRLQGYQTETNATQSSILPFLLCTAPDSKLVTISFLNCNQEMHSRDSSVTEERYDKPVEEWESKEDKTWMHLITSCCYLSAKTSDYFRIVFFFLFERGIYIFKYLYLHESLAEGNWNNTRNLPCTCNAGSTTSSNRLQKINGMRRREETRLAAWNFKPTPRRPRVSLRKQKPQRLFRPSSALFFMLHL